MAAGVTVGVAPSWVRIRLALAGQRAIDSIVDVVGTAAALDWLSPISVTCTSVAMGHGTVRSAHGVLPVPAPAMTGSGPARQPFAGAGSP